MMRVIYSFESARGITRSTVSCHVQQSTYGTCIYQYTVRVFRTGRLYAQLCYCFSSVEACGVWCDGYVWQQGREAVCSSSAGPHFSSPQL